MNKDPVAKTKFARNYALIIGLVSGYIFLARDTYQVPCLILSGICLFLACFDELLILMAENKDTEKADPFLIFPVIGLTILMIVLPFNTATRAIHYFKADNNISYTTKKDHAVVRQVFGGDTVVELADSYKDKPVTVIEPAALWRRNKMTEVILPDTLKEIGSYAFGECSSLTELSLPDGLESIGMMAFINCKNLQRVTVPASVTEIKPRAFSGCPKDLVIVGQPGSVAETFAAKAGIKFESAGS